MSDSKFVNGLFAHERHERAPDFVICKLSLAPDKMFETLTRWQQQNPGKEWMYMEVCRSRKGSLYVRLDERKPPRGNEGGFRERTPGQQSRIEQSHDDDLPF